MAEWLRSGLQSRPHRFDSGRRLSRAMRCRLAADYCGDESGLLRDPSVVYGQIEQAIADDMPHQAILLNACDPDVGALTR